MQFPSCLTGPLAFPFTSANCGTASYSFLTIAAGNMLRAVGSESQIEKYLKPMLEGRYFGTMNLSETQAGSSLGDITTRAIKLPNGKYSIIGNKMWISGGEHSLSENIIHMVLAKIVSEDGTIPPGVKGISLFIVPKYQINDNGNNNGNDNGNNNGNTIGKLNGVSLAGLNHKMGYRGTTNCFMSYGQGDDECIGELLGKEGYGLNTMFLMMNEARIAIGYGAAAQGYAGYSRSLLYAKERKQGRSILSKDPTTSQIPIIQHSDVKRMLIIQKCYIEGSLSLCMYGSTLVDQIKDKIGLNLTNEQVNSFEILLDTLTPIIKSWPSEWCLEANKWALQIHGGYGYTRDYDVEQIYRDNRLNMIHEGTNGIQSIDLLGRKVGIKNGSGYKILYEVIKDTIKQSNETIELFIENSGNNNNGENNIINNKIKAIDLNDFQKRVNEFNNILNLWKETTELLLQKGLTGGSKGIEIMLANSHEYLNATGHIVIGWRWLEMERIAILCLEGKQIHSSFQPDNNFYISKHMLSKYFHNHELIKVYSQLKLLSSFNDLNITIDEKYL